jgi:tight adherence protein B
MQAAIIAVAGLALLFILGGVVASVRAGPGPKVEDRLSRYSGAQQVEVAKPEKRAERTSVIPDSLERAVSERDFASGMQSKLRQADLKLKVSEYMLLHVASVLVFGLVSWFLFKQSVVFALLGALMGFFAPRLYVSQKAGKRRRDFENQLGDTLNLWVNALRSGYSVLQSMETIASETPEPISTEFERVVQEVRLGLTMEQGLNNLLERIQSDDMDLVVTAVNIQREVGGNLAEVLSIISHTIRERIRIKGEIRVLTAQATISGYIISGLPIALTLFLRASSPEYINELFIKESPWLVPGVVPCGWLVMGVGLLLIFSGFMVMRKIADIEV